MSSSRDWMNQTGYHKKYASGHYGYALLHFRKKTAPKWRLQILEKNQVPEMFDLFKKTFHHDITPTTWQWKYGSNSGCEIGIWRENKLIAHYGGVSRKILFFGQPQTAVQIGDVMVDTSERGTPPGRPFFLMAATFPRAVHRLWKTLSDWFWFSKRTRHESCRTAWVIRRGRAYDRISWSTRTRLRSGEHV
ncbi:MAG: GNAT family N-acetyltransferase [Nitrosomonas sp.]|nr:GNAT family N-acetyltransferase [Nitrosomonas sp.]